MRILKGQEILPDDSTLVQLDISDGSTVNVLIEPERNIEVEIQCGPMIYKHEVSNCMTVKELKALLMERKEVAFFYKHFYFIMQITKGDTREERVLENDSMPLHFYASNISLKLEAVSTTIQLKSKDPHNSLAYHKITVQSTVRDLKQIIMRSRCYDITDISMFVSDGSGGYKRLDEEEITPAYKLLPEDKTIYFITDKLNVHSF